MKTSALGLIVLSIALAAAVGLASNTYASISGNAMQLVNGEEKERGEWEVHRDFDRDRDRDWGDKGFEHRDLPGDRDYDRSHRRFHERQQLKHREFHHRQFHD